MMHLTTDKGGNIMAGIIKLAGKDICASEGQTLTVGVQKCLDSNASCLIKIDRVWTNKVNKAKSIVADLSSRNKRFMA